MLQEMEKPQVEPGQKPVNESADHYKKYEEKPEGKSPEWEGYATVAPTECETENSIQTQGGESTDRLSSGSRKSVHCSPELVSGSAPNGSDPVVARASSPESPSFSIIESIVTMKNALGRWRRKVGEATKKAEDLAENTWQHLKTSPSFAEAAVGRIAQGTKVLAEGGYERVFRQSFETEPEEQLQTYYACYLNTSAGPVMGILYLSTEKLSYCSDNPLSHRTGARTEWGYFKVTIPLHELKAVHPSSNITNPAEKYIQVTTVDDHEFWFLGFLDYDGAVQVLQEACSHNSQSV